MSPLGVEAFVTRRITRAIARIHAGVNRHLWLGDIDVVRAWGYATEHILAMWRMLQPDTPDDFVLATGTGNSVRDLSRWHLNSASIGRSSAVSINVIAVRRKFTLSSVMRRRLSRVSIGSRGSLSTFCRGRGRTLLAVGSARQCG